ERGEGSASGLGAQAFSLNSSFWKVGVPKQAKGGGVEVSGRRWLALLAPFVMRSRGGPPVVGRRNCVGQAADLQCTRIVDNWGGMRGSSLTHNP
ncbi:hypothetical protein U1Q18_003672, partial [Sarracenia purpurea var. burkii]